ncbi:MAG: deoxyribose-phosphate aldolase [Spirochaetales bacterium]|uniref:Deoxyribose-phosphate aldolase n=1 Tax=Candidatus Thalassospirochaeta sargassi TaxID=3119039 RepID=A0AAJ1IEG3_9SPIO|nr:deoxyribose-phosphate aldolase [Spirochaetales bacterium]
MAEYTPEVLAKYIDHTILKADATADAVDRICDEAKEYGFYSVCVNSCWVERCARNLEGSDVKVAVVAGFPLGAMSPEAKAMEAGWAVDKGASEIDMVLNVGAMKTGDYKTVEKDIRGIVEACGGKAIVKVILETCLLTNEEKLKACEISVGAGAGFVKTSTGFSTGGATIEDIKLMRKAVGPDIGVKASGGVRTREDAVKMIEAGATRLGASAGVEIVTGGEGKGGY